MKCRRTTKNIHFKPWFRGPVGKHLTLPLSRPRPGVWLTSCKCNKSNYDFVRWRRRYAHFIFTHKLRLLPETEMVCTIRHFWILPAHDVARSCLQLGEMASAQHTHSIPFDFFFFFGPSQTNSVRLWRRHRTSHVPNIIIIICIAAILLVRCEKSKWNAPRLTGGDILLQQQQQLIANTACNARRHNTVVRRRCLFYTQHV